MSSNTDTGIIRVHDGETVGGVAMARAMDIAGDWVVESQLPTAENNYTWYRKYKSGWVEMGGYVSSGAQTAVTFPKAMANTYYFASFMFGANELQTAYTGLQGIERTTTGMKVCAYYHNSGGYNTIGEPVYWKIEGMVANV